MYQLFAWTRASRARNELTRHFEPLQPHLLMALASRFGCDTFLDIGANVGAYSLLMSSLPSVQSIHAFEPSPDTFEHLRQNVALNNAAINVHHMAVSDKDDILEFGIVNTLSGANSVIDTSLHKTFAQTRKVHAVALDRYLPQRGRRLCIKVDVEGHEPRALAGMRELLSANEVVIQIEDYGSEGTETAKALGALGFVELFRIGADRYFTNVRPLPPERAFIELFEMAAADLVTTSLAAMQESYVDGVSPLTMPLGKSLRIELRGGLATAARWLRARLR